MSSPLEDVEFLARSSTRLSVLESLADGPRERTDLLAATGASQPTLSRVLDALASRGWIARGGGGGFELTPVGDLVAREFSALLETMGTAGKLAHLAPHLPVESWGFDLSRLADAEVVEPSESDPMAPIRRAGEQVRTADRVRIFSHQFVPGVFEAAAERDDPVHVETVGSTGVVEAIREDEGSRRLVRDLVASGRLELAVADRDVPHICGIPDDAVSLGVTDDEGTPLALLVSRDDAVRDWAVATFEEYRATAEPVEPADLDG